MPSNNPSAREPEEANGGTLVTREHWTTTPPKSAMVTAEASEESAASTNSEAAPTELQEKECDSSTTDKAVLAGIEARLDAIRDILDSRLRTDETKNRMFDLIYDELQGHRSEASLQPLKRLLLSLVGMYDNLIHMLRSTEGETQATLQIALDDLVGVLYPEEVVPFGPVSGTDFDPKEHRALKRIPTANKTEDRTIRETLRSGFSWRGKILRPADVCVNRFVCRSEDEAEQHTKSNESGDNQDKSNKGEH